MPTMANITVKKNDGITDVEFQALAGSSGENVPAVWRCDAVGGPPAFRPTLKVTAKAGANGKRVVESLSVFPITRDDANGNTTQVGVHTLRTIATIVTTDEQTAIDEAVSQGTNLADSVLLNAAFKEGYAPRS